MKIGNRTFDLRGRGGFDGISLERWRKMRHRIRKTKPQVTIAIGLISRKKGHPQIIFASDSQTTYGAAKSLDAQKISIVNFGYAQILVAQAGSADLADKAIEIMRKKAKDVRLENSETVAECIPFWNEQRYDAQQNSYRRVCSHDFRLCKAWILD